MILLADTVGDGAVTKEVTEATSEAVQEVGKFAEYVNDNIPELIGFLLEQKLSSCFGRLSDALYKNQR